MKIFQQKKQLRFYNVNHYEFDPTKSRIFTKNTFLSYEISLSNSSVSVSRNACIMEINRR